MNPRDAQNLSINLCRVAYRKILKVPRRTRSDIYNSSSSIDVLWKPDLVAFSAIKNHLAETNISFSLISESGNIENENSEIIAFVDELDGTRNFKDRSGPFAISVGIAKPKTNPHPHVLGAAVLVKDSWGARIYSADDKHAYKGEETLHCMNKRLENSSIAIGDYHTDMPHAKLLPILALYRTKNKKPLNPLTETVTGSYASAIDLCYCADPNIGVVGYIDLRGLDSGESNLVQHGIRPFDIVPSVHILECAGGKVTDAFGQELKYDFRNEPVLTMVAGSNPDIHKELVERVYEALQSQMIESTQESHIQPYACKTQ